MGTIVLILGSVIYFFNLAPEKELAKAKITKTPSSITNKTKPLTPKISNSASNQLKGRKLKNLSQITHTEIIDQIKKSPSFKARSNKMKSLVLKNVKEFLGYGLSNDPLKYNKIAKLEEKIAREVAAEANNQRLEFLNNPENREVNDRMREKKLDVKKFIKSISSKKFTDEEKRHDPDLFKN